MNSKIMPSETDVAPKAISGTGYGRMEISMRAMLRAKTQMGPKTSSSIII